MHSRPLTDCSSLLTSHHALCPHHCAQWRLQADIPHSLILSISSLAAWRHFSTASQVHLSTTAIATTLMLTAIFLLLAGCWTVAQGQVVNPTNCSAPVSCLTSPVGIPPPWFALNFSVNPATLTGATTTTFGWEATEAGDAGCSYSHSGIATFNSSLAQLIDLNYATGSNSSGYAIPGIIGGSSSSAGSVAAGTAGWSFELTVRPNINAAFSKTYSIGAGPYDAVIYLGTEATATNMGLGLFDTASSGNSGHSADFTLLAPYVPYQWYHIVFVQQQVVTANISHGAWFLYVNGVMQTFLGATENNLLPAPVARPSAFLAKSDWGDPAWGGLIDTFRIYNYALTASQVQTLYTGEMGGCAYPTSTATPASVYPNLTPRTTPSTTPVPIYALNFSTNPLSTVTGASGYGWASSLSTDSTSVQTLRTGLLTLAGGAVGCTTCQYVNMSAATGANSVGAVLPVVGGGTTGWSFEVMVQPQNGGADTWPKLIDIGGVRVTPTFCVNDIVLGWSGAAAAPDSYWQLDVCDNSTSSFQYSTIDAVGEVVDNVWYHFVFTISPPLPNGLANYFVYVNGQLYTTVVNVWYPIAAPRPNANLGKSNWADPYFSGAIDFFNVYQSQLSDTQVANLYAAAMTPSSSSPSTTPAGTNPTVCSAPVSCLTSPVGIPPPWFALNFSVNPATLTGATTTTFGWEATEAGDAGCSYSHSGIATFNSSLAQLIDLNYATGSNSSGYAIPGIIGGSSSSAGSVAAGTAGWSFELTVRPNINAAFSKTYSIGAGPYDAVIYLGTEATATNMGLGLFDTASSGNSGHSADFTLLAPYVPYQWYHIVFVQQQVVTANISHGAWFLYVNGVMQTFLGATENNLLPAPVARPSAFLAKSDWGDPAWGGLIDTFRIYNYALTASQVQTLYTGEMGGCAYPTSTATPASVYPNLTPRTTPSTTPVPIYALNFSTNPLSTVTGASGYGWASSLSTDSTSVQTLRTGLLTLAGGAVGCTTCQYVNMSAATGANSVGAVLPVVGGGTTGWSFEVMVQPQNGGADTWPKLIDIGGVRVTPTFCVNDIVLGWSGAAAAPDSYWQLDVCDNSTSSFQYSTIDAVGEVVDNVWYHFVFTISPPLPNGLANYFVYVNGQLYTTVVNVWYPIAAPRPNANLGKSNWADPYFSGAIDFFNVYQSQLSDTQVANLYAAAMTPSSSSPSTTPAGTNPTVCSAPVSCLTSPVGIPPPWFALNFSVNPATLTGATTTTFGWEATEAGDAGCSYSHSGIATFNSSLAQLIDLNYATGSNSSGYAIPGIIGGSSSSAGSVAAGTAGWSFELTVRPNINAAFSKTYSIGAGPYDAVIYLGTEATATNMGLGLFDTASSGNSGHSADFTLLAPYVPYQWYHIVFVQQQVVTANISHGAWFLYVNGVMQTFLGATENNLLPAPVARPSAFLAKSDWGDPAWGGLIDTFRIYNYALTASQVQTLYTGEMGGCAYPTSTATPASVYPNLTPRTTPSTTPVPIYALNFSTNPLSTVTGASGYGWASSLSTDSTSVQTLRTGLLTLAGGAVGCTTCQYVNMSAATGANSVGAVLPVVGGGTTGWSFEVMVQPQNGGADTWPKLIDIGGVRVTPTFCVNDIVLGWSGAAAAPDSYWQLDVCDNSTSSFQYSTIDAVGEVVDNVWYHFVFTISPPLPNGLANYFVYVNGQLYTTVVNVWYPIAAPRPNANLGKSNWADPYFSGAIDFFNVYQSQLSDTQVANLYAAAMTPSSSSPSTSTSSSSSTGAAASTSSTPLASTAVSGSTGAGISSSSSSSSLSGGAIAGIVVGSLIGVLLLLALLACILRRGNSRPKKLDSASETNSGPHERVGEESRTGQDSEYGMEGGEAVEMQ